jgi:cysteine desulfurase/selenocysteine lyase
MKRGAEAIRAHEARLGSILLDGPNSIPGVRVYGPADPRRRTAIASFMVAGRQASGVAMRLDEEYGVL